MPFYNAVSLHQKDATIGKLRKRLQVMKDENRAIKHTNHMLHQRINYYVEALAYSRYSIDVDNPPQGALDTFEKIKDLIRGECNAHFENKPKRGRPKKGKSNEQSGEVESISREDEERLRKEREAQRKRYHENKKAYWELQQQPIEKDDDSCLTEEGKWVIE